MSPTETHSFQAETSRLLHLVINSLYTTKDVFLRELVSNASDALDRLRFESLKAPELVAEGHPWEIVLEADAGQRTLTIHDYGIGMSRQEVIDSLGTIARSGTREALQEAADAGSSEMAERLIGQFGVGFYSAFMVAERVVLVTRRPGQATATRWESAGDGQFMVSETSRERCGTSVTLHLAPIDEEAGLLDFADPNVLERIVTRYSDYITWPIKMRGTGDAAEDRTLNAMKPLWTRPADEVDDDELNAFYRHVAHDFTEPLRTLRLQAEGRTEYKALLFLPKRAPLDFGAGARTFGLQLYARQVLITDRCEELLEPWLRFVKGVVDAVDLPLNVSREMLQHDRHLVQIRRWIAGRILKTLEEMARDAAEDYETFWREFGHILKEGYLADGDHRSRLDRLVRFASSREPEGLTSFEGYVERMPEGQPAIYYLTGTDRKLLERSPHLEALRDRGWEVLLLTDPVDELVVQALGEFDSRPLRSAAMGELDPAAEGAADGETSDSTESDDQSELKPLLSKLGELLTDQVREVRVSSRLTTSAACLVGSDHDLSPQLERILRAGGRDLPVTRRVLEVNPNHPLVEGLQARFATDPDDGRISDAAELLLGTALLAEGSQLPDPVRFSELVARMAVTSLGSNQG